jgi:hypothetical protein
MPSEKLVHECKVQANNGHLNNGTGRIVGMVEDAIKRARSVFLQDSTGYFLERNIHFRTRVENNGSHYECLVLEMLTGENKVALMLPRNDVPYSHYIIVDGIKKPARKMVKIHESGSLVDPFDCYFDTTFMIEKDGRRINATFQCFCYELDDGTVLEETELSEFSYSVELELSEKKIECPSILFAVMDTKEPQNDQYAFIKYLCMYKFGIQSQCIALKQYQEQKRKDQ